MRTEDLVQEIEDLRTQMVSYYLKDDLENAIKTSQLLDQKIYCFLLQSQKQPG